jgi:hypothetical protein
MSAVQVPKSLAYVKGLESFLVEQRAFHAFGLALRFVVADETSEFRFAASAGLG